MPDKIISADKSGIIVENNPNLQNISFPKLKVRLATFLDFLNCFYFSEFERAIPPQ